MSLTDLYIDTFTPQTVTRTADNVGGYTEAWADGTDFVGRLSILSANERMSSDKLTVFASHKIYCAPSVSLAEVDRIKHGTRYFEIKGIQLPSDLSTGIGHQEVTVMEID